MSENGVFRIVLRSPFRNRFAGQISDGAKFVVCSPSPPGDSTPGIRARTPDAIRRRSVSSRPVNEGARSGSSGTELAGARRDFGAHWQSGLSLIVRRRPLPFAWAGARPMANDECSRLSLNCTLDSGLGAALPACRRTNVRVIRQLWPGWQRPSPDRTTRLIASDAKMR